MSLGIFDSGQGFLDGLLGKPRDPNPNPKPKETPKTSSQLPVSDLVKQRATEVINKARGYQNIIGMPPCTFHNVNGGSDKISDLNISENDWHVLASMTILNLTPSWPDYFGINGDTGLKLYALNDSSGLEVYNQLLQAANINSRIKSGGPLRLAVINDYQITETFTSDYQESAFEGMADVGSSMGREIKAVTGSSDFDDAMGKLGDIAQGTGKSVGLPGVGDMAKDLMDKVQSFSKNATAGNKLATAAKNIAIGNKVDFPMIWSNSSYSPSYQFTCRLYNPYPDAPGELGDQYYIKYIVEPLAHIMAFMMPYSKDSQSYSFPVLCRASGGGIMTVKSGYMSSLDMVIGGEGNDIAFKQRPNQVDVRFTINHLYQTMIGKSNNDNILEDRPTFKGFVENLMNYAEIQNDPNIHGVKLVDKDKIVVGNFMDNLLNNIADKRVGGFRTLTDPKLNDNRISQEDLATLTDPVLDPSTTDPKLLSQVASYRNDVNRVIAQRGSISEEMMLALRFKNNIPVAPDLSTWFWNNLDTFGPETKSIVDGLTPSNQLLTGGVITTPKTPTSSGLI